MGSYRTSLSTSGVKSINRGSYSSQRLKAFCVAIDGHMQSLTPGYHR